MSQAVTKSTVSDGAETSIKEIKINPSIVLDIVEKYKIPISGTNHTVAAANEQSANPGGPSETGAG